MCAKRGEARGAGKAILLKTTLNTLYLSERRHTEGVEEARARMKSESNTACLYFDARDEAWLKRVRSAGMREVRGKLFY